MPKQDHGTDLVRVRSVAALTAAGLSRQKIAEELGVSIPTIQRAKAHSDFQQMVAQSATRNVESLQPLVDKVSTEVLEGMSAAVKALRDMLDATDAEGNPIYSVRKDAAAKLADVGVKLLPSGSGPGQGASGGQGGGSGNTSITFKIGGDGTVKVDAEATSDDDSE